jgi:hypothetical protein
VTTNDRSFSIVLQDIVGNIQDIVRSEVRLAKTEIREEAAKAKSATILIASGAICGVFGALFVLLAMVYGLTRIMPDGAAALSVGIALAVVAGLTVSAAMKRFTQIHPAPEKTIQSLKENVEWSKQHTK